MGDDSLREIVLPEGTVSVGARAFARSGLQRAYLPRSLESIADDAFEGCQGLCLFVYRDTPAYSYAVNQELDYELRDPESDPEPKAYGDCGEVPETVTWSLYDDGSFVIKGTGKMSDYTPHNPVPWLAYKDEIRRVTVCPGVTNVSRYSFNESAVETLSLPEGLTEIGSYAFKNCASLRDFVIPESVTQIWPYAFMSCTSLTRVDLPAAVLKVGAQAFASCSDIESVTVNGMDTVLSDDAFAFRPLIRCLRGSKAEEWAQERGFDIEYLDDAS